MGNVGFRIYERTRAPNVSLADEFNGCPTAVIADNMNRMACVHASITLYSRNIDHVTGVALTVKVRPGDNLMVHKAIDMAEPGDMIVIDAQGEVANAIVGDRMCQYAKYKGIRGMVIDGAIRDVLSIEELNFPVFAKAVTPKGPYKDGPGEINVSIACGGITVHPGDIIVGDRDGVVVISEKDAPDVLKKAKHKEAKEQEEKKLIQKGIWDRSWVDKTLKDKGVQLRD